MSDLTPEELKLGEEWADELNQEELEGWLLDFWYPKIEYYRGGQDEHWPGGPVHQTGWYVIPYCTTLCCRPRGPFITYGEAQKRERIELFEDGAQFPLAAWSRA